MTEQWNIARPWESRGASAFCPYCGEIGRVVLDFDGSLRTTHYQEGRVMKRCSFALVRSMHAVVEATDQLINTMKVHGKEVEVPLGIVLTAIKVRDALQDYWREVEKQ